MHTKILARAGGDGWWGSNPQVNFSHCAFLLIQANITGWEGGLQVRKQPRVTNHKNTPTMQNPQWSDAITFLELLVLTGQMRFWQMQRHTVYTMTYSLTPNALLEMPSFGILGWDSWPMVLFLYTDWNSSALLVYCHSPVRELPPRLRAQVQHSFPELTVYSNYQANKGPPCAVIGKGRWVGSRTGEVPLW